MTYVNESCHKAKELILQPRGVAMNTGIDSEVRVWGQACAVPRKMQKQERQQLDIAAAGCTKVSTNSYNKITHYHK